MHESRLCRSLIEMAERRLAEAGGERIVALRIELGTLSGVAPEALEAAFPICATGTRAEGATLSIRPVEGRELRLCDMEIEG